MDNGHSIRSLHERRTTSRDPVFVIGRYIRGEKPSKTFDTIREQCLVVLECLRMNSKFKNDQPQKPDHWSSFLFGKSCLKRP